MPKRKSPPQRFPLRELRQSLGLTQHELAAATGMQQSEVSRLERRGDYHVSTLRRIVGALGGKLEITARIGRRTIRLG